MWLINTTTLHLEKFQECPAKSYAILSHTWGADTEELDFDEFKAGRGREKVGFQKIELCCREAKKNGIQYAWVDTCCIDKRSSTELSEAINSMFAWYAKSRICYVYLTDVGLGATAATLAPESCYKLLRNSRWFTRGWTLQELVAPENLTFFTKEWIEIGDKVTLAYELCSITWIDIDVLSLQKSYLDCSVASRMSWASSRDTARLEDNAYCLLGLFDVNLPLMYGEGGPKAFLRLQKQIIEQTDDETIFAWHDVPFNGSGLLAPSATHFARAFRIESQRSGKDYRERAHYFNTNKGLSFECELIPYAMNVYVVPLNCLAGHQRKFIFLTKALENDQYRRIPYEENSNDPFVSIGLYKKVRSITKPYICKIFIPDDGRDLLLPPYGGFPLLHIRSHLEKWCPRGSDIETMNESTSIDGSQHGDLDREDSIEQDGYSSMSGQIKFQRSHLSEGVIIPFKRSCEQGSSANGSYLHFGFDEDFKPICVLYINREFVDLPWLEYKNHRKNYKSFYYDTRGWCHAKARCGQFRYDDHAGIILRLPVNLCEYIKVTLRPLFRFELDLVISEKRRHVRKSWQKGMRIDFCFKCLGKRLSESLSGFLHSMLEATQVPQANPDRYLFCVIFALVVLTNFQIAELQFTRSIVVTIIKWFCFILTLALLRWAFCLYYYRAFPEWSDMEEMDIFSRNRSSGPLDWKTIRID